MRRGAAACVTGLGPCPRWADCVKQWRTRERDERWSLYFFYRNGDVSFMFQFSEIKAGDRGFTDPARAQFPQFLYDYASRPYGLQWDSEGRLLTNASAH